MKCQGKKLPYQYPFQQLNILKYETILNIVSTTFSYEINWGESEFLILSIYIKKLTFLAPLNGY